MLALLVVASILLALLGMSQSLRLAMQQSAVVIGGGWGGWGAAKSLCEAGVAVTLIGSILPTSTAFCPFLPKSYLLRISRLIGPYREDTISNTHR